MKIGVSSYSLLNALKNGEMTILEAIDWIARIGGEHVEIVPLAFVPYNEPHRGFIHGDFHQWNILSEGTRITGIIDGNCLYGDSLVDLAILDRHMPRNGVIQAYQDFQAKAGIAILNFKERLIGSYYFKGLDGLRFYAKMGWRDAYQGTRQFLLNLDA